MTNSTGVGMYTRHTHVYIGYINTCVVVEGSNTLISLEFSWDLIIIDWMRTKLPIGRALLCHNIIKGKILH